jgi:serine/threonine-protein kinase
MSPEQCDGLELTPAADVYSLGCILYEMLTGTVPFSGATPLAIAVRQTSEIPRSPRDYVSSIPPALEQVVLHTLEKRPEDRPADAAEFREELLTTADRLGLEHAAITSSPNMAALRSVATESPSGRLVIDISRLRETLATNPDSELTAISSGVATAGRDGADDRAAETGTTREPFPRISLSLTGSAQAKKRIKVIAILVAAVLLMGIGFAIRSRTNSPAQPVVVASPSPSPTPEPTPLPSPSPSPRREAAKPTPTPAKNQGSRLGRILKKLIPGKH